MPSYRNLQILSASLFIVGLLQISWAHFFAPYFSEDFVLIEKSELEHLKLNDLNRIEDLDQNEIITIKPTDKSIPMTNITIRKNLTEATDKVQFTNTTSPSTTVSTTLASESVKIKNIPQAIDKLKNVSKIKSNNEQIAYKEIVSYINKKSENDKYLDFPPEIRELILQKLNNAVPYQIFENALTQSASTENQQKITKISSAFRFADPRYTILPFIHIPKTAGSTWRTTLTSFKSSQSFAYKYSWYPNNIHSVKSFNTPGCHEGPVYGGTHCSFTEMDTCLKKNYANLKGSDDQWFRLSYKEREDQVNFPRPPEISTPEFMIENKKNIFYNTILRHPITRVLSEFYWWSTATTCIGSWPTKLCPDSEDVATWVSSDYNTAHNRQFISLLPNRNFSSLEELAKNIGLANRPTGKCFNVNGNKAINYYGKASELSVRYDLLQPIFENIDNNFGFLGILEQYELSAHVARAIYGAFLIDAKSSLIFGKLRKEYYYSGSNGSSSASSNRISTKAGNTAKIMNQFTKQYRKNRDKKRRKRAVHSTDDLRPSSFPKKLIDELYQKNRLDMIIYEYAKAKLQKTLDRLLGMSRAQLLVNRMRNVTYDF